MDNGSVAGAVIMAICCFGCAVSFSAIGNWAEKSKKPVHFWSGSKVDPEKVSDIPAYNHANAVMWKLYAIPYYLAGVFGILGFLGDVFSVVSVALLMAACFLGIPLLVWRYMKIEKRYIVK